MFVVKQLLYVNIDIFGGKETPFRIENGRLQNVAHDLVNVELRVLAYRNEAKAYGRVFFGVKSVKHHGIKTVIVKTTFGEIRLVLGGIKESLAAEFDVMKHNPAAYALFIIPVNHKHLVRRVNVLVVNVLGYRDRLTKLLFIRIGIAQSKLVGVGKLNDKEIF